MLVQAASDTYLEPWLPRVTQELLSGELTPLLTLLSLRGPDSVVDLRPYEHSGYLTNWMLLDELYVSFERELGNAHLLLANERLLRFMHGKGWYNTRYRCTPALYETWGVVATLRYTPVVRCVSDDSYLVNLETHAHALLRLASQTS